MCKSNNWCKNCWWSNRVPCRRCRAGCRATTSAWGATDAKCQAACAILAPGVWPCCLETQKKGERERELEFTQVLCLIPPSRFIPTSMILVHSCMKHWKVGLGSWKMKFPFDGFWLIFRGELLVLGSILRLLLEGPIKLWSTPKSLSFPNCGATWSKNNPSNTKKQK